MNIRINTTSHTQQKAMRMPTNPRLNEALYLVEELGCFVFPLKPQSKAPATLHGFKDATRNLDQVMQWWGESPELNIGVVTGKTSNLLVVDIDYRNGGDDDWFNLTKGNALHNSVSVLTGNGVHHYFLYPANISIPSCKLTAGIDIKSDGGYVVGAASLHPNGREYQYEDGGDPYDEVKIAPAPAWLLDKIKRTGGSESASHAIAVPRNQWVDPRRIEELQSALTFVSAEGYETWIKVGMCLYSLGNDDIGFRLWDEWSQSSNKYDPAIQGAKWRSFAVRRDLHVETLFYMAQQAGWGCPTVLPVPVETLQVAEQAPFTVHNMPIPEILLTPPGILGSICEYVNATAYRQQPVFAVAASLSMCAALLARKVVTKGGTRTNLILCSLGGTGSGKDWGRQCIGRFLEVAGKDALLGGELIASGQALMTRAKLTPNALFQIDEFGDFLVAAKNPQSASHKAEIITNILRLHTSSNRVMRGTEYANQKDRERQDIEYPCINIHATTTPETFYAALGSRDLANGFLNRMLICESTEQLPPKNKNRRTDLSLPDNVMQWIESLDHLQSGNGNLKGVNPASPIVIPYAQNANALLDKFNDDCEAKVRELYGSGVDAIWNRAGEHAEKIALVVAMACPQNQNEPVISTSHVEWAIAFVEHWVGYLANAVQQYVSDSPTHAIEQEITRLLATKGSNGMTARELGLYSRKFRAATPAMRDAALKWLCQSHQINLAEISTLRGKKRTAYVLLDDNS